MESTASFFEQQWGRHSLTSHHRRAILASPQTGISIIDLPVVIMNDKSNHSTHITTAPLVAS